jgi:C4-dicarboxylate-specific signal transduction histidine kinase
MRFERKIFIAVFCSTLVIGSLLVWAAHRYASTRSRDEFVARYSVFNRVLADTLTRLDTDTEVLMLNAAQVVAERDAERGLLSTEELKSLRDRLGVTHIFMVDKSGKFIRSTNEDPSLIPNLYSFCDSYRDLLAGTKNQDATPVIQPKPEPKPYKFLFIPSASRDRIVEVGVRVDSIAKTLVEAIKADRNVQSMRLYSPDGTSFGSFSAESVVFDNVKGKLPDDINAVGEGENVAHFYSKVISSHPKCCQCDRSGTSKNGEYYYVLESSVSKDELNAIQARMSLTFVLFAIGNLLISFVVAKFLSFRLVRNIRKAVNRVRTIKESGSLGERIQLTGKDEVAFLTKEFDHLLDVLEESQKRLVEAEKSETLIQLARVVAHNIKSPIVAIEMMIPQLAMIPKRTRRVLTNSVREIEQLADKLRNKPDSIIAQASLAVQSEELVFLPLVIEDVINQKQIEYGEKSGIQISFMNHGVANDGFSKLNSVELRSILSNLINNAAESYSRSGGKIEVSLSSDENFCTITVRDYGCGIPDQYVKELGRRQFTFKGDAGRGLGLVHATQTLESWGGTIRFESASGRGTNVIVRLKKLESRVNPDSISTSEVSV